MGAKFANLQIYGADCSLIGQRLPDCAVRSFTPGWISVVGERIQWGSAHKEARRLSGELPYPVLSTEYFDGDYVEFAVYQNGKLLGKHIPAAYEGFSRRTGKPAVFQEAFSLSKDAQKQLQTVFKETDPELSLLLLSSILGCVLWLDQGAPEDAKLPPAGFLAGYLDRKAQPKKRRNQTKLTLSDELTGDIWDRISLPLVKYEDPTGRNKSIWIVSPEGNFLHCCDTDVPGRSDPSGAHDSARDHHLLTFLHWDKDRDPVYETWLFSADGTRHRVQPQGGLSRLLEGTFLSGGRLFCDGICYDAFTGKVSVDMGIGQTCYGIERPVETREGNCIFTYDMENGQQLESYLACYDGNGTVQKRIRLPDHRHWAYPILYQDFVYFLYAGQRDQSVLVCFDGALNEVWRETVPGAAQLQRPFLDQRTGMVYFASSYDTLAAFSLDARKLVSVLDMSEAGGAYLGGVLPGTGPILIAGASGIEVRSDSFAPLSRHRTKGNIEGIFRLENSTCILTRHEGDHGDDCIVRVYRLDPA